MHSDHLALADAESVADLHTFLTRARAIEDGSARLEAAGTALGVYVPVLYPEALGATVPTILGLRVARLAEPADLAAVYGLGALTDRLARMGGASTELSLPPVEAFAPWAGVAPPRRGWERIAEYDDALLRSVAEEGMRAVAGALPENAGKPVLATVRSRIWSTPAARASVPGDPAGPAPAAELPAGAAFAAHALGFLAPGGASALFSAGRWLRLSSAHGHVLVRLASSTGSK
ncbi:hypothetical protein NCCP1664_05080 [Zafaria cholistanensis]|uniref:Uncharacterized protein n=1 Tax=Zafaria cholistanensis TaxID=1682741 RepID=A0A5A7NQE4_9MICC|nr:hypothetical protein [Zafaria cholistanensis]GER22011.1 hypothetical protein NCCP1664_05080 [Zafaria cholistanensis]